MVQSSEEPDYAERTKYIREYDRERSKRARRLFHWSLNMPPEDDMNVQANRIGITWRELAAAGVLGLAAWWIYQITAAKVDPPTPPAASAPTDAAYDVRFYDAAGNEVRLDRWTGGPMIPPPPGP